jgi:trimeric autotransporter adhesin
VTIAPGQTSASFPITTTLPATDTTGLIRATYQGVTRTNSLLVVQYLAGVVALPSTAIGGTTVAGRIFLNGPAPSGGITIALKSNNAAVQVPVSASFPFTTTAVNTNTRHKSGQPPV